MPKIELIALGDASAFEANGHSPRNNAAHDSIEGGNREAPKTICEVADLVDYFLVNDRPSGIQRVQIELIRAVQSDPSKNLRFICFRDRTEDWVEIGEGVLALIIPFCRWGTRHCLQTSRPFADLSKRSSKGTPFQFRAGDIPCDFGATWAHASHLFAIDQLKEQRGLRYLPCSMIGTSLRRRGLSGRPPGKV